MLGGWRQRKAPRTTRQQIVMAFKNQDFPHMVHRILAGAFALLISGAVFGQAPQSVSYTHLTLPTKRIV